MVYQQSSVFWHVCYDLVMDDDAETFKKTDSAQMLFCRCTFYKESNAISWDLYTDLSWHHSSVFRRCVLSCEA